MRRSRVALSVAALVLGCNLVPASELAAQQRFERGMPIARDASIRVFNLVGSTRVTGWDRDSIAVTGAVPARAGQLFIGGGATAAKIGVFSDSARPAPATLDIRVPRGSTVWIKSSTADVFVFFF